VQVWVPAESLKTTFSRISPPAVVVPFESSPWKLPEKEYGACASDRRVRCGRL